MNPPQIYMCSPFSAAMSEHSLHYLSPHHPFYIPHQNGLLPPLQSSVAPFCT